MSEHLVREQFKSLASFMPFLYVLLFALDVSFVFYNWQNLNSPLQWGLVALIALIAVKRGIYWKLVRESVASHDNAKMRRMINKSLVVAVVVCLLFVVASQNPLDPLDHERKLIVSGLVLSSAIVAAFHLAIVPKIAITVIATTFGPISWLFASSSNATERGAAAPVFILAVAATLIVSRQFQNFREIVESREALKIAQAHLKAAEQAALAQAHTDSLTGLFNRRYFDGLIEKNESAKGHRIAVALIDLDGFKQLNDQHGHAAGDQLLKLVAGRLYEHLYHLGEIMRLGGDEFLFLCRREEMFGSLEEALRGVLVELSRPYVLAGTIARVGASSGLCLGDAGANLEKIVEAADRALYDVKKSGKGFVKTASSGAEDFQRAVA